MSCFNFFSQIGYVGVEKVGGKHIEEQKSYIFHCFLIKFYEFLCTLLL